MKYKEQEYINNIHNKLTEYYTELEFIEIQIIEYDNQLYKGFTLKTILISDDITKLRFRGVSFFNQISCDKIIENINREYLTENNIDLEKEIIKKRNLRENLFFIKNLTKY